MNWHNREWSRWSKLQKEFFSSVVYFPCVNWWSQDEIKIPPPRPDRPLWNSFFSQMQSECRSFRTWRIVFFFFPLAISLCQFFYVLTPPLSFSLLSPLSLSLSSHATVLYYRCFKLQVFILSYYIIFAFLQFSYRSKRNITWSNFFLALPRELSLSRP